MAACPSCGQEFAVGSRWCALCRASVVPPFTGHLASPGRRIGAYVLDGLIPLSVLLVGGLVAVVNGDFQKQEISTAPLVTVGVLLLAFVGWALFLLSEGTSPGKQLLGMWVMKRDGRRAGFFTMLIRETIGKIISGMLFSLGFLWILFDRENQGWHDKLLGTYVVRQDES